MSQPRFFNGIVWCCTAILACGCMDRVADKPAATPNGTSTSAKPAPGTNRSQPEPQTGLRFVDVAASTGASFVYRNGWDAEDLFSIVDSLGGGVGLIDFDLDGRIDLLFAGGGAFDGKRLIGRSPGLFHNGPNLEFHEVTRDALPDKSVFYNHGVTVGDYDNDGFPDALITGYGGLMLLHNLGDGRFEETSQECGLTDRLWSSTAAWGDVNGDGYLDLYVGHYVNWSLDNNPVCYGPFNERRDVCQPKKFEPLADVLYVGDGAGGFRDASAKWGLRPDGKGLSVLMADVDLDGDLDVYVANDTTANFLYRNDDNRQFTEIGVQSGTALSDVGRPDGSMGIGLGDFDLDGLPDLWITNYQGESFAMYRNTGNGSFLHVSRNTGLTSAGSQYVGWGTTAADFDLDGDEDLFVSNGHVIRYPPNGTVLQEPLLFENVGKRFINVARSAGRYTSDRHMGRGVAAGDIDLDGDIDLVVSLLNEPAALLLNESERGGHWIAFRLIGRASNRDSIGARVTIQTETGRQTRQIIGGGSFASTHGLSIHFGLGPAERVEEYVVVWPSGARLVGKDVAADRYFVIPEPPLGQSQ